MPWSSPMLIPFPISSRLRSLRGLETDIISRPSNGTTAVSPQSGSSYFPRLIHRDKCQCISLCTTPSKICRQGYLRFSAQGVRTREMSGDMYRTRLMTPKYPTWYGGSTHWTMSGLTSPTHQPWISSFTTILTASLRWTGLSTVLLWRWHTMESLSNSTHASTTTQTVARNLKHALTMISNNTFQRYSRRKMSSSCVIRSIRRRSLSINDLLICTLIIGNYCCPQLS